MIEIGRELAACQDEVDGAQVDLAEGERRILATVEVRRFNTVPWLAAAALLLSVVGVAAWLHDRAAGFRVLQDGRMGRMGEWIAASNHAPVPIQFDDGTELSLQPGGRARVTAVDAKGATVIVERGELHASVKPRMGNRWRIDVGPFSVAVIGTVFDVSWQPESESFSITLRKGSVKVGGPIVGTERSVHTGERLDVWVRRGELKSSTPSEQPVPPLASSLTESPQSTDDASAGTTTPNASVPAATPALGNRSMLGVRKLARDNRYTEALLEAQRIGFAALCAEASAADVLLLGDVARLTGNLSRAQEAYLVVRRRFTGNPSAQAAFMLGRMAHDQRGAYREATEHFTQCLREAPEGPFAREASSRLIEARMHAGDNAGARAAAVQYLERYPSGPYADRARELIFSP